MQVIDLTGHAGSMSWEGMTTKEGTDNGLKTRFVIEDSWPAPTASTSQDKAWLRAAIGHAAVSRSAVRIINPDIDEELMRELVVLELRGLGVADPTPEAVQEVMEHVNKVNPDPMSANIPSTVLAPCLAIGHHFRTLCPADQPI